VGFHRKDSAPFSWQRVQQHNYIPLRGFSTDDDTSKKAEEFLNTSTVGVGQVIFLNSVQSGRIIGAGLFVGDPYLAILAGLGTVTATAAAKAAGLDKASIEDGLLGYNGCLVGCAAAVFGPSSVIAATTATIVGASATPFVAVTLKEAMGSVPQWTFAFNFVTLTSLLRTRPLLPEAPAMSPSEFLAAMAEPVVEEPVSKGSAFFDVLTSPFTGISQIFVVQSPLSGAIILGGIGSYSPMLALHALGGSTMGMVVGAIQGAPIEEIGMGLYGFNSALTSMAVGVFFVHSTPTIALSAAGAAATSSLFGAMKTVFGAYGAPCCTLPFCITMSACYMMQKQVPGLVLASSPHSPEKNK